MTPEEAAAMAWYGNLTMLFRGPRGIASAASDSVGWITEVLPCPVCGAGVANMSSSALTHKQWHEQRGEVPSA